MSSNEISEHTTISSNDVDHQHNDPVPDPLSHVETVPTHDIAEEEVRGILKMIASTGKFWHDWDQLKSLLSFQLKQVLSEYPETKMSSDQQNAALGETAPELLKRLDEAIGNFIEGPPFTLQRLCEILLTARSIYPSLLKLALALEKNLLVTSTLTICGDPYPPAMIEKAEEPEQGNEVPEQGNEEPEQGNVEPELHSNSVPNGVEPLAGDRDEIMAEVEEADIDDDMTIDMETFENIDGSSEASSTPTNSS